MKQILIGKKSRFGEYIMRGKPPLHLKIAIAVTYAKGKRGKHGVENLGYVVTWHPLEASADSRDLSIQICDRVVVKDVKPGQTPHINP